MTGIIQTEEGYVDWEVFADPIGIDEDGEEIWTEDYVRINNLFVEKTARGRGVARSLMQKAIEQIGEEHPGMNIKIVAEPKDDTTDIERLISFYDSLGLEVIAV